MSRELLTISPPELERLLVIIEKIESKATIPNVR